MSDKLFKVFIESYVWAEDMQEARDIGYDSLTEKIACGGVYVEVEEVDE